MSKTIRKISLSMATTALLLSACASIPAVQKIDNMVDYNYAGADAIVSRMGQNPTDMGPVLVASLVNVDKLDSSSTFGRISADEIGSRLSQRGFSVLEARMRYSLVVQAGGEFMLSDELKAIAKEQRAANDLVGTYADSGLGALVSLKLVRVTDSTVIGSSDYTVPLSATAQEALLGYGNGNSTTVNVF